jgi:hypothetical protein
MYSKQLEVALSSRLFFLFEHKVFCVRDGLLTEVDYQDFEKTKFPIVVVGRDNYQENNRRYPVSSEKDLRQILNNESENIDISSSPRFSEGGASVQTYRLDTYVKDLIAKKWCFWIPESWLLNIDTQSLLSVSRAGKSVWGISLSDASYSTMATGAFSSADYFLMSIGSNGDIPRQAIAEESYVLRLLDGFRVLSTKQWRELFKAQAFGEQLLNLYNWPSLGLGLMLGYLVFITSDLTLLNVRHHLIDSKISEQKITRVVAKQKQFESKNEALAALANTNVDKTLTLNMWKSVLALMEGGTNILRVVLDDNSVQLRIQAPSAADSLTLLRQQDFVNHADFTTPIRNSLGNERVTIGIRYSESNDG